MIAYVFAIDPLVTGIAVLVVVITEIACRIAEAGALVDAAIRDETPQTDGWWDNWSAKNERTWPTPESSPDETQ
jgi:hypothetical protein